MMTSNSPAHHHPSHAGSLFPSSPAHRFLYHHDYHLPHPHYHYNHHGGISSSSTNSSPAAHQLVIPQSQEMIKKEVTSSFDVKPLEARPCFPQQAQVLPFPSGDHGHQNPIHSHGAESAANIRYQQQQQHDQNEHVPHPQGLSKRESSMMMETASSRGGGSGSGPGGADENFIYIHRQNSLIDLSQMTHCDHSHLNQQQPHHDNSTSSSSSCNLRSNEEVDAAITLANGLKVINLQK